MRQGQRFGLSEIEKRDVWSRWKAGQSLHEIGRAFDKPHSCIRSVLLPRGGIPQTARSLRCDPGILDDPRCTFTFAQHEPRKLGLGHAQRVGTVLCNPFAQGRRGHRDPDVHR